MSERAMELIAAERQRQVEEEGFTPEHDDEHIDAELSGAAVAYADYACRQVWAWPGKLGHRPPAQTWRWSHERWKPSDDPIRNLVKAGALIVAEIERLRRAAES